MSKSSMITMWVIIAVIVILIIGVWWYFMAQNTSTTTTTQTQTQSSDKSISSFSFSGLNPEVIGVIDNTNDAISLTVPKGTNVTNLVPTITVSDYTTVSPTSGVAEDFTNPIVYTVTAQDGSTQAYTVTVTASSTAVQASTSNVTISNFSFNPAGLTVKAGTKVTWTNNDSVAHTVTGNNGGPASSNIAPGSSYSYTFTQAGTFNYHCSIHPSMTGSVVVTQ